jgi:two-component system chemotaxis response regulator CheB
MVATPLNLVAQHPTRIEAVVVGASAGAVEALNVLLPPLPHPLSASLVVLVHLSARVPSLLPELFISKCAPPVREPVDKQPVGSGTIWFAPENYHLLIERERTFSFSVDAPVNYSRPSIDVLFESAAIAYGPALLALVLTGASRDGCNGAMHIRRSGGLVAVQDPNTAVAPLLPRLVLERAEPQMVGSLSQLSQLLLDLTGADKP